LPGRLRVLFVEPNHTPPRPVAIATVPNLAMHADALLARINLVDRHAEQLRRHRAGRDIEPQARLRSERIAAKLSIEEVVSQAPRNTQGLG
jgi:hypothetical protein